MRYIFGPTPASMEYSSTRRKLVRRFLNSEWQQMKKRGLAWLLLFSCVMIAFVVAQQGETVDRQRELIQILDFDSRQLHSERVRELINRYKKENPTAPDLSHK